MSTRTSRRDFMNLTGAGMAGFVGAPLGAAAAGQPALPAQPASSGDLTPDLVVVNATVYTMDPRAPRAEAFAVKDGRFVAVGSTADVRNLGTSRTQGMDGKGMTVVPGVID